jgi:methionyl aminopeptidase
VIKIKSALEIEKMRKAGKLAFEVLNLAAESVKAGISTQDINDICHEYTLKKGAKSAPLNYHGFPKSICTSVNNVVCHGIPSPKHILKEGDIINCDITVLLDGYHGDTSKTFMIGEVPQKTRDLVERTEKAMYIGIESVKPNAYFGDIGENIDNFLKPFAYGIVRDLSGHGIGKEFHEDPQVIHHKQRDRGQKMKPGMIFTVEPMINMGTYHVYTDTTDNWTVYSADKSLSAQFEHTVLVTDTGYEILTKE